MDFTTLYVLIFTIISIGTYLFNILSGLTLMRKKVSYLNFASFVFISFTSFISSVLFFKNFCHYLLTCNYVYSLYENYQNLLQNSIITVLIFVFHVFMLLTINNQQKNEIIKSLRKDLEIPN